MCKLAMYGVQLSSSKDMKLSPLGGLSLGPVLRSFSVGTVTFSNFLASVLASVKLLTAESSSLTFSFDLSGLSARGRRSAKALGLRERVGAGRGETACCWAYPMGTPCAMIMPPP